MIRHQYAIIAAVALLAACTTPPTPAQIQTGVTVAVDLAQIAGAQNKTVQTILAQGALICGKASSVPGQLVIGTAVAIANAAGAPVSVTGQLPGDVAAACAPLGLVPGPAPAQASIPVQPVATVLPAVS